MQKKINLLVIILILQTVAIFSLIYIVIRIRQFSRQQLGSTLENIILEQEEGISISDEVALTAKVSAGLVWWDQDEGLESIKQNSDLIYSISPFWYELDLKGEIKPFTGVDDAEITEYLKNRGVKITPVISNEFRKEPLATIIANAEDRKQHIEDILAIALKYDGVSLNYENLTEEDKESFTQFVTELAEELYKNDKTLAVHLHAKDEEPGSWDGPKAQDWESLGKVCDKLKIMAYDFHWATSEAGAIAPYDWVESVAKHAVDLIPKEKVYLGIPLYGYDWVDETGEGVTFEQANVLVDLYDAMVLIDDTTKSPYFTYLDNENTRHDVWFENAGSVKTKLEIAKEYELGGVDLFRLGGEDEKIWKEIGNVFGE